MDGAMGVIHILNSPDLETPVDDVAVTLYVMLEPWNVGVPLMVHVPWFSASPMEVRVRCCTSPRRHRCAHHC